VISPVSNGQSASNAHRQPPQPVRSALVHFLNLGVKVNLACCGLDSPRPFLAAKRDLYSVFAGSEALQLSSTILLRNSLLETLHGFEHRRI
jgi:hypothetical protein